MLTPGEAVSRSRRSSLAVETSGSQRRFSLAFPESRLFPALSTSRRKSCQSTRSITDQPPKPPKIANTYKLKPDEDKRFQSKAVEDVMHEVLESQLSGVTYSADKCKYLTSSVADEVKEKIKQLKFDRFKIVCVVHIGQQEGQCMRIASRCLWDTAQDRMATSYFSGDTLFACATVFGIYQE